VCCCSKLQEEVSQPNVTSFAENASVEAAANDAEIFAINMCNNNNVFAMSRSSSSNSSVDSVSSAADNDSVNSLLSTTAVSCTSACPSPFVRHRFQHCEDRGTSAWSPDFNNRRLQLSHDWLLNDSKLFTVNTSDINAPELLSTSLLLQPESVSCRSTTDASCSSNDNFSPASGEALSSQQASSSATWPRQRVAVNVEHITLPNDEDGRFRDDYSIIRTVAVGKPSSGEQQQQRSRHASASTYDAGYGSGHHYGNVVSKSMDDVTGVQSSRVASHRGPYPPAPPSMIISPRRFSVVSQHNK
jgi:hypothetical protein